MESCISTAGNHCYCYLKKSDYIHSLTVIIILCLSVFSLISSMLKREPKERISLSKIVNHPWMIRDGRQCCDNSLCVALVGKEHLAPEDQESIIQRMIEGGIGSRSEILRCVSKNMSFARFICCFFELKLPF